LVKFLLTYSRDDLTLDGTPTLNLASFVTTYMEEEAEKLMVESFSKNFIDYEEYPVSAGEFRFLPRHDGS
jgi:glutamate/tyrosine decarboxylase-like PLP-dependent enzyme